MTQISINDFYFKEKHGIDYTLAVSSALELARGVENPVLSFTKGTYHFYPDHAFKGFFAPSNNDASIKAVTFPILKYENLVIDANESDFVFHGRISPFVVEDSNSITIRNFSIDYERPFYSQGKIMASTQGYLDLDIQKEKFPFRVENKLGKIIFIGENWENDLSNQVVLFQEYDEKTKAPGYNAQVFLCTIGDKLNQTNLPAQSLELKAEELENGLVRLWGDYSKYLFITGNILTISHENRENSAVFLKDSKNISVENVTIHHAPSMGIIAQTTENINIDGLVVALNEHSRGLLTINADATHFVNCSGLIKIENSVMENMNDDGVNIHGIYTVLRDILAPDTFTTELIHFQQHGVNIYKKHDKIAIMCSQGFNKLCEAEIESAEFIKNNLIKIRITQNLSEAIKPGDVVDNFSRMPEVEIRGCRTGKNRPRGFLLTTPKRVLIENNTFSNSLYAIHIAGDTTYWFESGQVNDVTIKENTFNDCCYAGGDFVIAVTPEFKRGENELFFHRNISIINNTFCTFDDDLLYAYSADGLVFSGNRYHKTNTYKSRKDDDVQVSLKDCKNAMINDCILF
jgi:hypothetical protein